ncbi:peptidase [Microcystis phage Me-ZS1]|nr:peptidase [Microcystis phage Me-ZS1]
MGGDHEGGITMYVEDWTRYPNFTRAEFACRHTGECRMQIDFMDKLQKLRVLYGKSMRITSGYRHPSHPVEARKGSTTGEHTQGAAADIAVEGADAIRLLRLALEIGFSRIGVQQKGTGRFIHLGIGGRGLASPTIWSY